MSRWILGRAEKGPVVEMASVGGFVPRDGAMAPSAELSEAVRDLAVASGVDMPSGDVDAQLRATFAQMVWFGVPDSPGVKDALGRVEALTGVREAQVRQLGPHVADGLSAENRVQWAMEAVRSGETTMGDGMLERMMVRPETYGPWDPWDMPFGNGGAVDVSDASMEWQDPAVSSPGPWGPDDGDAPSF